MTDEDQQDRPEDAPDDQAPEATPEEHSDEHGPQVEGSPEAGAAADETGAEPEATEPQADEAAESQPKGQGDEATEPESAPDATEAEPEPKETEGEPEEAAPEPEAKAPPSKPAGKTKKDAPEAIPGEHLEPDLVLEEEREQPAGPGQIAADEAASEADGEETVAGAPEQPSEAPEPAERKLADLAADARYLATGKRKSAIARVILKPGSGVYTINGRELDEFFPRPTLRKLVRQPLEAAGYTERVDVVAKIHGGGVSSQAGALRHGVARALVEADPNLRGEMKGEGFLRRDPRVKERKKAGLKKARKRPQFSKR